MEAAEPLRRRADKVRVGTAGPVVALAAVGLGEMTELAGSVAGTDPVEGAAPAQPLAGQFLVLRFLADAGLVDQHPFFGRIAVVPAFYGLAVRCTGLLKLC